MLVLILLLALLSSLPKSRNRKRTTRNLPPPPPHHQLVLAFLLSMTAPGAGNVSCLPKGTSIVTVLLLRSFKKRRTKPCPSLLVPQSSLPLLTMSPLVMHSCPCTTPLLFQPP